MKNNNQKSTCYKCGESREVIEVNGIKSGAIKTTKIGYCKICAPNLHK